MWLFWLLGLVAMWSGARQLGANIVAKVATLVGVAAFVSRYFVL